MKSFFSSNSVSITIKTCCITTLTIATAYYYYYYKKARKRKNSKTYYEARIGKTPLILLPKLSEILNQNIYVKMESLNPGGTGKDRAAYAMLQQAGLSPGSYVVEGTSGSTGISLAHLCQTLGYKCILCLPDDQAHEKQLILKTLGAELHIVPNCSISNPNHYVNKAKKITEQLQKEGQKALFVNQFENLANFQTHFDTTGPEILQDLNGSIDVFVMSSGTGGTIAGVGTFLKQKAPHCKVILVDPPGSVLHSKVKYNVAFVTEQCERKLLRHRYDTIAEGIGLDRVCANFAMAVEHGIIDDSVKVADQEAVDMAHWLLQNEGLFVGSSSAMNVVGAVRVALQLNNNQLNKVVTIVCDSGFRHLTRFWNRDYIENAGLVWPSNDTRPNCLQGIT